MNDNQHVILIVDDSPTTLLNIKLLLSDEPYTLLTASNGEKALALAGKHNPDLVLLDVIMPGMDGFAVCKALRTMPGVANVPILMLTGLDDPQSRLTGLENGADDFITKPFDAAELKAKMRTILSLDRARRIATARERFNWVIETAHTGYIILDRADHIEYANQSARQMFDLNEIQPGTGFLAAVQKSCNLRPEYLWQSWPEPLPAETPEKRLVIRPGSQFAPTQWLEVDIRRQQNDPDQQKIIRLRDVTQARQTQENVWTFHRFISHKLRTPMNGLYTGLEMLHDSPEIFAPQEVQEIIALSYESLLQIRDGVDAIERYLGVSRASDPNTPTTGAQIPALVELANQTVGLDQLYVSIPDALAAQHLAMSSEALTLALAELLDNARKFHPEGRPHVCVALAPLTESLLRLEVADDGATLPTPMLERVWQPYYQAEAQFTGEVAGMGLGLAMVASLVWRAGGSCRMVNRPERSGIIVELDIPMSKGQ